MTRLWWYTRRVLFALFSAWLVISIAFGFVVFTGDPGEAYVRWAAGAEFQGTGAGSDEIDEAVEEAVAEYREARDYDEPVRDRYVTWMGNVVTLEWGDSHQYGTPVTTLIQERLTITAVYVVPAMGIAVVGGTILGTYAALGEKRRLARLATGSSYALYGLPNFWIASVLLLSAPVQYRMYLTQFQFGDSVWATENLTILLVAALILGSGLLASQARYVRSEVLDVESEAFVRTLQAMGTRPSHIYYDILRVAAIPLTTLFISTLLGVLILNVIVIEYVFEIPGFGMLTYRAILDRDLPVIIGTTMVIAFVGIVGNLLQDTVYEFLDPRVSVDR